MRRRTLEAAAAVHLVGNAKDAILKELADKIKRSTGFKQAAAKRRHAMISADGPFYHPLLDTSDLVKFDAAAGSENYDGAFIWDVQEIPRMLLKLDGHIPIDAVLALHRRVILELVEDAQFESVWHCELQVGLSGSEMDGLVEKDRQRWNTLLAARKEALALHPGVSLQFIPALPGFCRKKVHAQRVVQALRDLDVWKNAAGDLNETLTGLQSVIPGFGFYKGEENIADHAEAFRELRDQGFKLVCIHAGEGYPSCVGCMQARNGVDAETTAIAHQPLGPRRVREALAVGAQRIGHGIEAVADASLVRELAEDRQDVCLEVCPISNRALGNCGPVGVASAPACTCVATGDAPRSLREHPLKRLLRAGVQCCVCSDDPCYWAQLDDPAHGLVKEFWVCREMMGLDDAELAKLAAASFEHSAASKNVVDENLKRIREWLLSHS
jgi:adenosine deaminase